MKDIAYYNGEIGPIDEVRAPVTDRGFYFGDGVYEAAACMNQKPFALSDHMDRFYNSLRLLEIAEPMPRAELDALLRDLISRVDASPCVCYWQVTRGVSHRMHAFPKDAKPSLLVFVEPTRLDSQQNAMKLLSREDTRFLHCNIKTLNLIPNVVASQRAHEAGCDEVVFHRADRVTEGAHSGIAILKDGAFCTPPADELILPSITRLHCLQLCEELGIPVRVAPFTMEELMAADEVLVLSTGAHCIPVSEVDGKPVGGKAPDLLQTLQKAYQQKFEAETAQ